jgi:uncharacterized membrane protein YdjX (TVP38/TMEM64 family)
MPGVARGWERHVGGWLPLVLVAAIGVAVAVLGGKQYVAANARWLSDLVTRWPLLAPLFFVAADVVALMIFVPPSFCTVLAGLLFGPFWGAAYALAGTTLGATGVFLTARNGFSGLAARASSGAGLAGIDFHADAFSYLVVLRLLPFFPFALVNIAAALSEIRLATYVLGTLIGIVPSIFIFAWLGSQAMDLARQGEFPDANVLLQSGFLWPLMGLAVLALLPAVIRRYWRRFRSS